MLKHPKADVVLTLLLACGMGFYYFGLFLPRTRAILERKDMAAGYGFGGDFYPIWVTGRELLFRHANPYAPQMTVQIQRGLYGRAFDSSRAFDPPANYRAYSYPLYADFIYSPLLLRPFRDARLLLAALLAVLTTVSISLWSKALNLKLSPPALMIAVLLVVSSYPLLEGFYALQPALLVNFVISAAMLALRRQRLISSGVLLAVASIKPQIAAPLLCWLLSWTFFEWKTRRALAMSLAVTLGIFFFASELVLPGWWRYWLGTLLEYRTYTIPPLAFLLFGRGAGYLISFAALCLAVVVGWRARRDLPDGIAFQMASVIILTVSVVLLPTGDAVYDLVVLIPAFLWIAQQWPSILRSSAPVRALVILLSSALLWQWLAAIAVVIASFANSTWSHESNVLLLPVRTAASLPFAVLAVLACLVLRPLRAPHAGRTAMGMN